MAYSTLRSFVKGGAPDGPRGVQNETDFMAIVSQRREARGDRDFREKDRPTKSGFRGTAFGIEDEGDVEVQIMVF